MFTTYVEGLQERETLPAKLVGNEQAAAEALRRLKAAAHDLKTAKDREEETAIRSAAAHSYRSLLKQVREFCTATARMPVRQSSRIELHLAKLWNELNHADGYDPLR